MEDHGEHPLYQQQESSMLIGGDMSSLESDPHHGAPEAAATDTTSLLYPPSVADLHRDDARVQSFFTDFVPDGEDSEASGSVKVLKGLFVVTLLKRDAKPAYIGQSQNLMLGSLGCAYNLPVLQCYGVSHILTVGFSIRPKFEGQFTYKILRVKDVASEDLLQHFDEAMDFIDQALAMGGKVLVHCFMGKSRSTTVVCAYLMRKHKMRVGEALALIRRTRPHAQPNSGFMAQLRILEKQIFGDVVYEEVQGGGAPLAGPASAEGQSGQASSSSVSAAVADMIVQTSLEACGPNEDV